MLPATNIGRFLEDGEECILLRRGDALEIAEVVERLLDDDELRARLGRGARAFAERSFSWERERARSCRRFYERVLGGDARLAARQARGDGRHRALPRARPAAAELRDRP